MSSRVCAKLCCCDIEEGTSRPFRTRLFFPIENDDSENASCWEEDIDVKDGVWTARPSLELRLMLLFKCCYRRVHAAEFLKIWSIRKFSLRVLLCPPIFWMTESHIRSASRISSWNSYYQHPFLSYRSTNNFFVAHRSMHSLPYSTWQMQPTHTN